MMSQTYKIEVQKRTIVFAVLFILLLQAIWMVRDLMYSLIVAFIVMSALNPVVTLLQKHKIPRVLSSLVIFIILIGGISYLFAWIIPTIVEETAILIKQFPHLLKNIDPKYTKLINFDLFSKYAPGFTNNAFQFVQGTFSNALSIITTIFFSFYFLVEEQLIKRTVNRFFSKAKAQQIITISEHVEKRMREWMWGELILMLSIGLLTFIGLTALGVNYVAPLALFAGLLEIVPLLGPIFSAVPAFLLSSTQSYFFGLTVLVLYFVIQQFENQILVPIVMRRAVGLSPIVTLAALIIGGKFGGVLGILLSIPITLCLETIIIELSVGKKVAKLDPAELP
jgi:predicted PurR-regulated permease PerM